jgi:hypothetical protein
MTLRLCALFHVCLHLGITKFECEHVESLYLLIKHTHILMFYITKIQKFKFLVSIDIESKIKNSNMFMKDYKIYIHFKNIFIKILVLIILVISWEAW